MYKLIGIAALFCLTTLQPGQAAPLKHFKVGSWEAGAYSDDGLRNKFSHCAGSVTYKSGIIVTLIINREYKWGVALANPAWNLKPGADVAVAYVVDGGEPRATTAKVVSNNQVLIGFGECALQGIQPWQSASRCRRQAGFYVRSDRHRKTAARTAQLRYAANQPQAGAGFHDDRSLGTGHARV